MKEFEPVPRGLEVAARIGRQLCRDAVWHDGQCTWLAWAGSRRRETADHVAYGALRGGLMDGTGGISLFLAYLAQSLGDRLVARTARAGLRHAVGDGFGIHHGAACERAAALLDTQFLAVRGSRAEDEPACALPTGPPEWSTSAQAARQVRCALRLARQGRDGEAWAGRLRPTIERLAAELAQVRWRPQASASLLEGWSGWGDALLDVTRLTPNSCTRDTFADLAEYAESRHNRLGFPWYCGGPGGVESPDVSAGLAGIGWFFLRLARPDSVPSPFDYVSSSALAGRERLRQ